MDNETSGINQKDFLTELKQIPLKSLQKLKKDFVNNIQLFKEDLNNYTDKQLKVLAKYLDIPNYETVNTEDLKLSIARSQADISQAANLKITITVSNIEANVPDDCLKGYEIKNLIASGGYASVYIGTKLNDKKVYAIKFMNLKPDFDRKLNPKGWDTALIHYKKVFKEEVQLLQLFNNNDIGPKLYDSWICEAAYVGIIVTEKWDGSLHHLYIQAYSDGIKKLEEKLQKAINKNKKDRITKLNDDITKFKNALNSLEYNSCNLSQDIVKKLRSQIEKIHELGYIHYDITPSNILIKKDSSGKVIDITLTDFGLTRKKNEELYVDINEVYKIHKSIYSKFFDIVSFEQLQKNPILYDYSILYYLETCNPKIIPGKYPGIEFKKEKTPKSVVKVPKVVEAVPATKVPEKVEVPVAKVEAVPAKVDPVPAAKVPAKVEAVPVAKVEAVPTKVPEKVKAVPAAKVSAKVEAVPAAIVPEKEKPIIEPIEPTNNDKIIITKVKKPIGQVLGEEIAKPSLYELESDFRQQLLLEHLSTFVVDNQIYKSIDEYNKKMFDNFTKQKLSNNTKTLTQILNKGLFAAYTQDLTRRNVLLNTRDSQLYYLSNDKLIRQSNLETIRKCIRTNLRHSELFRKI